MKERSVAKSLADEEGQMLTARIHTFTLPWESQETTCEGDYKQLEPAVYHSTLSSSLNANLGRANLYVSL